MNKNKLDILLTVDFLFRMLSQMSFSFFSGAIYLRTGKASNLAWVSLATFMPSLILTYYSNRIIHGITAKKSVIYAIGFRSLLFLLFAIYCRELWQIYILIVINSFLHQLGIAGKRTYDAAVIAPTKRINYNSVKALLTNIALIVGPVLGGSSIAYLGFNNSLAFLFSVSLITFIASLRMPQSEISANYELSANGALDSLNSESALESLRYLLRNSRVGSTVFSYCIIGIILAVQAPLLFPFVEEIFHRGPDTTGLLLSLAGIGGISGALLVRSKNKFADSRLIPWLILFDGICFFAFTQSSNLLISAILFTTLGIMSSITLIIVEGLIQSDVPPKNQPFVFSLTQFTAGAGGASIGIAACFLTEQLGAKMVLASSALIEVILSVALLYLASFFRKMELPYEVE